MRHTTTNNYDYAKIRKERNTQPSRTVPDQALSIKEILTRFARGIPLAGNVPVYEDQETLSSDGVDFNTLDLSEQHAIIQERQEELSALQAKKQKETVSKHRKKIIDEYEKQKAASAATNNDPGGSIPGGSIPKSNQGS